MANEQPTEKFSPGLHLRRACDMIASKIREPGDSRSTLRITSQYLDVNYQTLVGYANEVNDVPIELAKRIDKLGYPKRFLRPDVWEE